MNAFDKTLLEMTNVFTSNQFYIVAEKNGVPKAQLHNGVALYFLKNNKTIKKISKKTWCKNIQNEVFAKEQNTDNSEYEVNRAIALLKGKGYKISRPINDWVEV